MGVENDKKDFDLAYVCLFVFVALRPMSTAMVIAGHFFPGQT